MKEELESYDRTFPVLKKLLVHLKAKGSLSGMKVGWHCHLTGLTAAAVEVLVGSGADLHLSECSAATTDGAAVDFMQEIGAKVYLGADSAEKVLAVSPTIISDTGFVLNDCYGQQQTNKPFAACEITTSGVQKMRALPELAWPVININDGNLKRKIENFHGVGDGVLDALRQLTSNSWRDRKVSVIGYGDVGAGVAYYLRQVGALVTVVDQDPIKRLVAHYDGFALADLAEALPTAELVVTATGSVGVIGSSQFELLADRVVLFNVGHWDNEIDLAYLKTRSSSCRNVAKHLAEYVIGDKKVYLATAGSPVNVVLLSGSIEPTLIHLTTELLCMNYLLESRKNGTVLAPGEHPVPAIVESQSSLLALSALADR
ncbi:MAG: hypothetical protein K2W82_15055 [Candidatus Obscuribacterales bacterium]|nr:hypothetical protein [Candidatus Obscuribacterales bacterium]